MSGNQDTLLRKPFNDTLQISPCLKMSHLDRDGQLKMRHLDGQKSHTNKPIYFKLLSEILQLTPCLKMSHLGRGSQLKMRHLDGRKTIKFPLVSW